MRKIIKCLLYILIITTLILNNGCSEKTSKEKITKEIDLISKDLKVAKSELKLKEEEFSKYCEVKKQEIEKLKNETEDLKVRLTGKNDEIIELKSKLEEIQNAYSSLLKEDESLFVVNEYHPVIFLLYKDKEGFFSEADVLGGSKGNKWFSITDFEVKYKDELVKPEEFLYEFTGNEYVDIDLVKGRESYKLYSCEDFISVKNGMKPILSINGHTLDEILNVKLNSFKSEEHIIIGINGEWNALPRIPKELDDKGIYSIDLDNDGKEEILRIQEKLSEEPGYKNAKDITLMIEKNGENIIVEESFIDEEYSKDYRVLTLDLNGDGKLEILSYVTGHNTSVNVFELNNDVVTPVLGYYNGD